MTMTEDFFRKRLDQLIDLLHTLAVLFNRMPWQKIEAYLFTALPGKCARANRSKTRICLARQSSPLVPASPTPAGPACRFA